MADIFISYAREDRETAQRLSERLTARGWSVFWDRNIPAGKRFDEVIGTELANARASIVLWSAAANASQWVAEEAEAARQRGILVPACIQAVEPPLGFRRIQAADLVGWEGDPRHAGFSQLADDLARMLGSGATMTATAAQPAPRRRVPLAMLTLAAAAAGLAALGLWQSDALRAPIPERDRGIAPVSPPTLATPQRETPTAAAGSPAERGPLEAPPAPTATMPPTVPFTLKAVIDDPDSYTNVRSQKTASSDVVARVTAGDVFLTHVQDGAWWQIKTRDGKVGFMHVSRIRLLESR